MSRRRNKASVNNTTVATPDVPTRMLNGGMSLSAIFKAGQLTPQARLTHQHNAGCRVGRLRQGEAWHVRGPAGREEGGPVYHRRWPLAQGPAVGKTRIPCGHFVMLHRSWRCVTEPRDFRGLSGRARRSPRRCRVTLNIKGLAPTVRDGAEPAELPKEQNHVAGEKVIISGMAGRYATALFELAREQNAIDRVKVDLDRFDALVAEVADLARLLRSPVFSADEQTRALSGVLDRAGIDGLAANVLKLLGTNRRLFAALDMVRAYRCWLPSTRGRFPP